MANQSVNPAGDSSPSGADRTQQLLERFLAELDEAYPDGYIDMNLWDHEHWDRPAKFLMQKLGYATGREFLEDQGFMIRNEQRRRPPTAEDRRRVHAAEQKKRAPVKFNTANAILLLIGSVVFVAGVVILLRGIGQMQNFL